MAFTASDTKTKTATPQLNVTPLVDVALVVLIIFMIVAPMLTKTFTFTLPGDSMAAAQPSEVDEQLLLSIDRDGALTLNHVAIEASALEQVLPARIQRTKEKLLSVEAADELPYGQVIQTVDRCRQAGATNIAMVTKSSGFSRR